ncbi:MAG: hypothetical protein ACMUJM_22230 [bacterium]
MGTYHNDYDKNEDPMMWELHEVRHQLAEEFKHKTIEQINKEAMEIWLEWKAKYSKKKLSKAT